MWFFSVSLEEFSTIDLSFHVFFSHVLWHSLKAIFLLSPDPEGHVWPSCVGMLPPQAIWLHHRLKLGGGRAGKYNQPTERDRQQPRVVSSLYPCSWFFAISKAIRTFSLLFLRLYFFLSFSAAATVSSSDEEHQHSWAVSHVMCKNDHFNNYNVPLLFVHTVYVYVTPLKAVQIDAEITNTHCRRGYLWAVACDEGRATLWSLTTGVKLIFVCLWSHAIKIEIGKLCFCEIQLSLTV